MDCCPTCGQVVSTDRVFVTLEANTITFRSKTVKLRKSAAEVAAVLVAAMPRHVEYGRLLDGLYGNSAPEWGHRCVQVFVCQLRRDLLPLGLTVENIRGRSYRMIEGAMQESRRKRLEEDDVRAIRASRMSCAEAAKFWQVSRQNINQIRRRATWRHVT